MARHAIRVGLKQVRGISRAELDSIAAARREAPFRSLEDFCRRASVSRPVIENLILCGAFDSLHPHRRELLWELNQLLTSRPEIATGGPQLTLPGSAAAPAAGKRRPRLPQPDLAEKVRWEVETLGMCVHTHPTQLFRTHLAAWRITPAAELQKLPDGARARIAGVVLCRMRPPTRSGAVVVFITLEDETGLVDSVIFPRVYDEYGTVAFGVDLLVIEGRVQRQGAADLAFIAEKLFNPLAAHGREQLDGRTGYARKQMTMPVDCLPTPIDYDPEAEKEEA